MITIKAIEAIDSFNFKFESATTQLYWLAESPITISFNNPLAQAHPSVQDQKAGIPVYEFWRISWKS